jgi:hypothetical protein
MAINTTAKENQRPNRITVTALHPLIESTTEKIYNINKAPRTGEVDRDNPINVIIQTCVLSEGPAGNFFIINNSRVKTNSTNNGSGRSIAFIERVQEKNIKKYIYNGMRLLLRRTLYNATCMAADNPQIKKEAIKLLVIENPNIKKQIPNKKGYTGGYKEKTFSTPGKNPCKAGLANPNPLTRLSPACL